MTLLLLVVGTIYLSGMVSGILYFHCNDSSTSSVITTTTPIRNKTCASICRLG